MPLIPGSRVTKSKRILPVDLIATHLAKHANIAEEHMLQIKLKAIEKEEKVALRELKREKQSLEQELKKQEHDYFNCQRVFSDETLISDTDSFKRRLPVGPSPTKARLPRKRLLYLKEILRAMPSDRNIARKRVKMARRKSEGDVSMARPEESIETVVGEMPISEMKFGSDSKQETTHRSVRSAPPTKSREIYKRQDPRRAKSASKAKITETERSIKSVKGKEELPTESKDSEVDKDHGGGDLKVGHAKQAWGEDGDPRENAEQELRPRVEKKVRIRRPQSSPIKSMTHKAREVSATTRQTRRAVTAVGKRTMTKGLASIQESKVQIEGTDHVTRIRIDVPVASYEEERNVDREIRIPITEDKKREVLHEESRARRTLFSKEHCIVSRSFERLDEEEHSDVIMSDKFAKLDREEADKRVHAMRADIDDDHVTKGGGVARKGKLSAKDVFDEITKKEQGDSTSQTKWISEVKAVQVTPLAGTEEKRFSRKGTIFVPEPRRLSHRRESLSQRPPGECPRHHGHHEQKEPHKKKKVSMFRKKSLQQELYGEQVKIEDDLRKKVMGFLESNEEELAGSDPPTSQQHE